MAEVTKPDIPPQTPPAQAVTNHATSEDLNQSFNQDIGSAWQRGVQFVAAATYFFYWYRKAPIRHSLYSGSLRVLQLFTIILVLEVIHQFTERPALHWIVAMIHKQRIVGLGVFFISALFLFWHHQRETKKPEYEYKFLKRLYELVERSQGATPASVSELLDILFLAFKRTGIKRISIHLPDTEGTLIVNKDHVRPEEKNSSYFLPLRKGEGVAGRVFADLKARYVPRLAFPNWSWGVPFGHCVKLAYRENPNKTFVRKMREGIGKLFRGKATASEPDFVPDGLELEVFRECMVSETTPRTARKTQMSLFHSLLSVPLRSTADRSCVGVLNFDFESTNPLDKGDIAMAMVFGILAGDVVAKQRVISGISK